MKIIVNHLIVRCEILYVFAFDGNYLKDETSVLYWRLFWWLYHIVLLQFGSFICQSTRFSAVFVSKKHYLCLQCFWILFRHKCSALSASEFSLFSLLCHSLCSCVCVGAALFGRFQYCLLCKWLPAEEHCCQLESWSSASSVFRYLTNLIWCCWLNLRITIEWLKL